MSRPARLLPVELCPAPWPEEPSDDVLADTVRRLALTLRAAVDGRSLREFAADADLDRITLQRLLDGRAWPDLLTIAKLEFALETTLWPPQTRP
jgi:DNA-binding phage protein